MKILPVLLLGFALYFSFGKVAPSYSAGCANPTPSPNAHETITCSLWRANTEVWRINQPFVKQKQTTYPDIIFVNGDLVSVFAGGCVQTGGSGLTWKRYVRPVARDQTEDNHYFGQITIPGFGSLRRIRDAVLAGGIAVMSGSTPTPLILGYLDNGGHGDNGYSGRDDGLWEQCRDLSNAFVEIVIQHNCATSSSDSCIHGLALDKVVTQRDPNGFPVNPQWVWAALVGTDPSLSDVCSWSIKTLGFPRDNTELCVTAETQKDIATICDFKGATAGRNSGHVNIIDTPVTYNTSTSLDSVNFPVAEDDDFTFNTLAQPTAQNQFLHSLWVTDQNQSPQVEFSTHETVGWFEGVKWWSDLVHAAYHNLLPSADSASARQFFGNHEAVVIGLLGFDCAHSCNTELHPAFAFFVHNDQSSTWNDDVWEFFVRNRGGEGFCGTDSHVINVTQMSVLIPKPGSIDVKSLPSTVVKGTQQSAADPAFSVTEDQAKQGAIATFSLPTPDNYGVVFGELHLKWTFRDPPSWRVQDLAALRAQGVSDAKIQAAMRANSARAMVDLREKARVLSTRVSLRHQKPRSPEIEEEIADRVAKQSSEFQAKARREAAELHLLDKRLDDTVLSQNIKAALSGVPVGSHKVLAVEVPLDPQVESFHKQIIQLLPNEAPSNRHPELKDKLPETH